MCVCVLTGTADVAILTNDTCVLVRVCRSQCDFITQLPLLMLVWSLWLRFVVPHLAGLVLKDDCIWWMMVHIGIY